MLLYIFDVCPRPFDCEICGASYYRRNVLKQHMIRCRMKVQGQKEDQEAVENHLQQTEKHSFPTVVRRGRRKLGARKGGNSKDSEQ